MGRDSSHGVKGLLNLSPIILKAGHLGGQALPFPAIKLPERAMDGCPLDLGLVAEDKSTEFSCAVKRLGKYKAIDTCMVILLILF